MDPRPTHILVGEPPQSIDIRPGMLGPCISVAHDKVTNTITVGQNVGGGLQSGLHQPLQDRADDLAMKNMGKSQAGYDREGRQSPRADVPGSHSEVQAVSQGMQNRTDPPPQVSDFNVLNQGTGERKDGTPKGQEMACCTNSGCQHILGTNQPGGATDMSRPPPNKRRLSS